MKAANAVLAFSVMLSLGLHGGAALAHGASEHRLAAQVERETQLFAPAANDTLAGTVHELIVDDPTRGTSERRVELQLDDGAVVSLQGHGADGLVDGSRVEVTGRRRGQPLEVDTARTLSPAPTLQRKIDTEIEGTLAVLHADYFDQGSSAFIYEVHPPAGRPRRLHIGSLPASLEPGVKVRVHGRTEADGESITPRQITVLGRPTGSEAVEAGMAKAATANRVLVIMANFSNTAAPAFTAAQAQQVMTGNADSVANYFRETSYGQQVMNITVPPGWVTMSMAAPASCGSSDWSAIGTAAEAAARKLGAAYDPATYNFVVYLFPGLPACGWIGLAYIGNPHKAWINGVGAFRTNVVAHEMGHNFGLLHAANLRCTSVPIGGTCVASEYGDPFSAMGNQGSMHYNAVQKAKLAWIPATSVRTHAGGTATYTLNPLEVAGGSTYAVKIPTASSNRTYWLEFRQPLGFDAPLASLPNNGVQIRVAAPFETPCSGCDSYSDDTELLDMTPSTASFSDAALVVGNTYRDSSFNVNVTVLSFTAGALTVQVAVGGSSGSTPTATAISATPNPSTAGSAVTFTATVTGSAPGGSVSFTDNGTALAGCNAVGLTGSGNVRSAVCSTTALAAGNHPIVARYSGDTGNSASASAALTQVVSASGGSVNVALASNGAVVTASSSYSPGYAASGVIDGRRSGSGWGSGGGWNDGTSRTFPDWVEIRFNGPKTLDRVVVYTLQDNYQSPIEPTDTMTFTKYGVTDFDVQGWNGSTWVTLAHVGGNSLVKRTVPFAAYTTDRIRIQVTGSKDAVWSRITEIEAWTSTAAGSMTNHALASNGATASASSAYSPGYPVSGVNDNRRAGAGWGNGGGWNDGTGGLFPDWVQINFNGQKPISRVVVYTLQDNYRNPVEPTDTTTFSAYGVTAFDVQGWNGSTWVVLAHVTGNNLVKRTVSFAAYTTDRIRISITGSKDGVWSRITEIEAWGP